MFAKSISHQRSLWGQVISLAIVLLFLVTAVTPVYAAPSTSIKSISVAPQSGLLNYGSAGSATYLVTVSSKGGAGTITVALSVSGLPAGVTGSFSPSSLTFTGTTTHTSTLTVTTSATTPAGAKSFTVKNNKNAISGSGTLTVNPKTLTVTAKDRSKIYGTAVTFTGSEFTASGLVNSDSVSSVTLTSAGSVATASVASYPIVPSAAVGTGLSNYSISYTAGSLTVTAAQLHVTGITANGKVYDGNTNASLNTGGAALTGILNGDSVTLDATTAVGTFDSKNVGLRNVAVSGMTITGPGAGNYQLVQPVMTATVSQASLTVTNITVSDKTYDGSSTATLSGSPVLSGVVSGDAVTLSGTPSANFADANAGNNKPVTVAGYSISGNDSGNYTLSQPSGLTASINPATLTVTADNYFEQLGVSSDPTPSFPFSYSGFVNNENETMIGVITTEPVCSVSDPAHTTTAGTYGITCASGAAANYSFSYVDGTLTVNAVNTPPGGVSLSNLTVKENLPAGTLVGNLSTVNPYPGSTYSYSLPTNISGCDGPDNSSFRISASGGNWFLETNVVLHYVTKSAYSICVETNDGTTGFAAQHFTVTVLPSVSTFTSVGSADGWVLESSETSGVGGTMNSSATTLRVGDDASNSQYRSILSFNTAPIPDTAVILNVTLKVKRQGQVGALNIFTALKGLRVDIRKPSFGLVGLQLSDFQASTGTTGKSLVGNFGSKPVSGWYSANLFSGALSFVNKLGTTQFRIRFYLDDNNNHVADYLSLYSGNATAAYRPQLIITYSVP